MAKSFETEKYTIGKLLGRWESRRVVLPAFQRSYSWEKSQVTAFLDDLVAFEVEFAKHPPTASYFLGSVVVIDGTETLELLDGQQRLATASIVLAAMRDVARRLDKPKFLKGGDLARDIQRELIEKEADPISYALTLGELDEPFFLSAIKADPPSSPPGKLRSHSLMQSAYALSVARLEALIKGKTPDVAVQLIKGLRDALAKGMTMIGIKVASEEDAYTIFEALNDRGLRLSVPDLLLNLLMRRASDQPARKLVRQHWDGMLKELGRKDVSRFLRHLWVSQFGDLKSEGMYAAIKRELTEKHLSSVSFAEQCADECDTYVALLDQNVPLSKSGLTDLQGIVKYLGIASAPPLLLAGYRCLGKSDFEKLLRAIVTTHVRYFVFLNKNPLDIESKFFDAARIARKMKLAKSSSTDILAALLNTMRELAVEDSDIVAAIDGVSLQRSEGLWLMTRLANTMQSKTKEIAMDRANLEHIFPQSPRVAAWPKMALLEPYLWNIGNLTILGERINREAQNRSFAKKKDNHYSSSEIKMTQALLAYSSWSNKDVLKRAASLAEQVNKTWPAI